MEDLISIIVPIYNEGEYLEDCLDSIIGQSYRNLEILMIDDGSADESPAICDRYSEADDRIRVFHIEKLGLSGARNCGIENAQGKYLGFVDADDYVEPDLFEKLHRAIVSLDCDISMCGYSKEMDGRTVLTNTFEKETVFDIRDVVKFVFTKRLCVTVWNKLFKAEIWRDVRFPAGHNYEDVWVFPQIMERCRKVCVIPDVLYHYRQHKGSVTRSWSWDNINDNLRAKEALAFYVQEKHPELRGAADQFLVKIYTAHWYMLQSAGKAKRLQAAGVPQEEIRRLKKELRDKAMKMHQKCGRIRISRAKRAMIVLMEKAPGVAGVVHWGYRVLTRK